MGKSLTGSSNNAKNTSFKQSILSYFANTGNAIIPELSKRLTISVPKVTAVVNELIRDGLVQDYGKIESTGGRKPNLYGIAPDSAYFIGVDVKQSHVNIGLLDLQKNLVNITENLAYRLDNTEESLEMLCQHINTFINGLTVPREKILGIGLNLSGRINYATGYSYSFFFFNEQPLSQTIERKIGIRVFLENDTRAMAYGEFCAGVVNGERNVLFLNLDYGIGVGILIDGQLYYGKSGYAGELGHIPIFDNELICHCGKKGCLETEASGWALTRLFRDKLQEGSTSVLLRNDVLPEAITMEAIIQAALNEDVLSIELIARVGASLGRGIAFLINVFNPELVILGGSLAATGEYLELPMKTAINKYSLSLVNNDTQMKRSKLGEHAGIVGACLLVRDRVLALI